jgi:hypothetical protein
MVLLLYFVIIQLEHTVTRAHYLHLNCSKIVFGRGFVPDPTGELTALPQHPLADLGEGKGKASREGKREGWSGRNGEAIGNLPAHFLEASAAYALNVTAF